MHLSDLTGRANVSPTARAYVGPIDLDDPNGIHLGWQGNETGPARGGVSIPLRPRDHPDRHVSRAFDRFTEFVDHRRECVELQRPLEIDRRAGPGEIGPTGAKTGPGEDPSADQVLGRVKPHVQIPAPPIERSLEFDPDLQVPRGRRVAADTVHYRRPGLEDVDDLQGVPPVLAERAVVRRLPASRRVKERAVEHDRSGRKGRHARAKRSDVGRRQVDEVREFGHASERYLR